jgi:ERCC4-related helicase
MTAADTDRTPYPPGARILVRDTEWLVRNCTWIGPEDGFKIRAVGVSEFVREEEAVFFTKLEDPQPELLRPEQTRLVHDDTSQFAMSRLYLEATLRRTPLPQSERRLALADKFLLDELAYQQRPAELALNNLWPRILLADVVGLGKTLEIGLILAELIRRGRGDRILVVTPQQVLEQFQLELWTRFSIPLIRLDSLGIERIQREIPAGRNPFTHYKRIIISIDTLKNEGKYGQHLDAMRWDAVVIDESHNLIGSGEKNLRNRLAKRLANKTDALLLASATPHNGDAESFAELIAMLDPAAIADPKHYAAKDIAHLYLRRTKISPEVSNEIGTKWRERGPSDAIRCHASAAEEAVFAELTNVWLHNPANAPGSGGDRRLFPYTLLKTFLSSHKALAATARKRAKSDSADSGERIALERLADLADEVTDGDSAKLGALVTRLTEIGVGPKSVTRAVVFSESVPTLEWLHKKLPALLGLTKEGQVELMHGGLSDTKQQEIIERFALADTPVRVLLTGDVASEGVNMHKQCHHLIHYDLPWSLIRIEQRNGRIDRYGQEHQPQFAALILTSAVDGAKDDTTVAEKLLKRERTAHDQLGTAEGVTRQFTSKKEEDRLVKDLLAGKTADESIEAQTADAGQGADFLADLLGGVGDEPDNPRPEHATVPRLFESTEAFAQAAITAAAPELRLHDDGEMLAFRPPDDLVQRLSVLPPSYLKAHDIAERMRVTFSRALAQESLDRAARSKDMLWPDIAFLSDLHPLIEWLTDKVLIRVPRQQAPVLAADVTEPTFLVQGVYSNALGQPTVVEWMAVTGLRALPGRPAASRIIDMTQALRDARVGPDMVNTLKFGDLAPLLELVPVAIDAARAHLAASRAEYDERVNAPIEEYRKRLVEWEQLSLDSLLGQHRGRRDRVRETVGDLTRMTEALRTAGEPLLRILAVLTPNADATPAGTIPPETSATDEAGTR